MKIGISTSTFFNTVAAENVFDILRKMRVDTTEMCLTTFSDYERLYVDMLASLRAGMDVVAVSPLSAQFEPQLFSPNMRVRADAELIFRKVCYACFAFGAKFYTFSGPLNLYNAKNFDIVRISQRIVQLQDIASTYGVNLSLKNNFYTYAATPTDLGRFLERCPRLFATINLNQAERCGYDIRDYIAVVPQGRVSLVEAVDFFKAEPCLPGHGKYKFDRLFAELDRYKCTAPVVLSAPHDCYTDFVQVRDAFEYLVGQYKGVIR